MFSFLWFSLDIKNMNSSKEDQILVQPCTKLTCATEATQCCQGNHSTCICTFDLKCLLLLAKNKFDHLFDYEFGLLDFFSISTI